MTQNSPVVSATSHCLRPFGATIFSEVSRLAAKHNAVNLGQGFPDFDGPEFVKQAAVDAIHAGHGQYARMFGMPDLNRAIADFFQQSSGLNVHSDQHITVTSGCTEAIAATMIGLINPGDEVILIEPYYDSYPACVAMTGGLVRTVTLKPPHFSLDSESLARAFTSKTRAILVNTPHNPTGKVFSRQELQSIADLCIKHDVVAITDEVYERLVFSGEHLHLATFPGMWERTITLSSLGKTFSLTGWKIGWAIAPEHLTNAVRAAHQFITFATATPLQVAAATALRAPNSYFEAFRSDYRRRRDLLLEGLHSIGLVTIPPDGTYFIVADCASKGFHDDTAFCRHLIEDVGVAAIPCSAFHMAPAANRTLVRFAFCKREETLREGLRRLEKLR